MKKKKEREKNAEIREKNLMYSLFIPSPTYILNSVTNNFANLITNFASNKLDTFASNKLDSLLF